METAIQTDEAGCRALLDALGDAVLFYDAAGGEIREANRKLCEMFGYSPEEARGLNIRELVGAEQLRLEKTAGVTSDLQEWQVQDRSGRQFWVEACLNRTVVNGREQVSVVLRDISRRQPAEMESFATMVMEGSLAGLYLIQDGKFRYVNLALAQKFGYRPEEIIDRLGPLDLVHPEEREQIAANLRRRLSREEAEAQYCFRGLRRDGATIRGEILARYTEYQGRPAVMGVFLDVTERVQAEQARQASEEHYRAIVEDQTELITRFWPDTTVTFANEANCRYFGVTLEELQNGSFLRFVPEEDWHLIEEALAGLNCDNPTAVVEHRVINGQGEIRWQQWSNRAICDDQGRLLEIQAVGRDITERKVAEEALKEAQERFRQLADNLEAVFWMRDLAERQISYINAAYERIWGRTVASLKERPETWLEAVHPEDREHLRQRIQRKSVEDFGEDEYRIIRPDGQVRWINTRTFPVRDEHGEIYRVAGISVDITERKQAEEDLKASEDNYRTIFNAVDSGIAVVDLETGNFLDVNQKWCQMTGFSPEEARGLNVGVLCFEQPPYTAADAMRWIVEASRERPQVFEYMAKTREGRRHWVEINLRRVFLGGQERLLAVVRDVTERKMAEEALQISEDNYRTIFNSANDGIGVLDMETGRFLDVNQKWLELSGCSLEETKEMTFEAFCQEQPPFSKEDAWAWFDKARSAEPQVFEWYFKDERGRISWTEVSLKRTVIGGKECILTNVRDITERQRTEEALRDSEAKYRNLVEQTPAIVYVAGLDDLYTTIYVSPQIETILGYTPAEWQGDPEIFKNRIHPEDRDRVLTDLVLSYASEGRYTAEYRMLSKSGRVVWLRDESRAVYDSEGEPLFMQGVALDITQRKKAEEDLREARDKLQALVQASPLGIIGIDPQARVMSWNAGAERIFGWRQEEVIGRRLPIVQADKVQEFQQLQERELRGEQLLSLELRRQKKDGSLIDISLSTAPLYDADGKLTGSVGIIDDITARKRTEEALRESEARFRAVFEGAPIGMALMNLQRMIQKANPALRQMMGFSETELPRIKAEELTHPDDWGADSAMFTELVAGRRNRYQVEKRFRHQQGRWVWGRLSVSLVRDAAGQPQFAIAMVEDITERKRAQEATEEIKRQQEAILSNISDIAWLKDRDSRFIVVNESFGRACGLAPDELAGKTDLDVWPADLAARYRADDREVMHSGKRKRVEEPLADRDGKISWIETIKAPIFNERGEVIGTVGTARDITARRRMEEALHRVSRALKTVTECHQALLRATNETELLNEVCRIIVEVGGYHMAWVGFARQDEEKSVRPMAHKGFEDGYVQSLRVSWADLKWGRGPTGTAIRTGKPVICRNTQTDPRFVPWREEAFKRGYASVLGLPLEDPQPFGALTIYATEVNAFDDEEINLLIGLANDLAFGIKALRAGAERRRAEEALRESEQKYRSLMDGASDAIVLMDTAGRITKVNRRVEELLGYSEEELLGLKYPQIHPPQKLDHVRETFANILATGTGPLHECIVMRKDGTLVPADISHIMVEYGGQRVIQTVIRDVTERKRAGEALRDSEQKLRLLASQLLTVQEKERHRVSRELHDELGQALTVLKIHLVAIENKLRRDQQGLKLKCERLLGYIDAVIENVRRLSWDLSPSILEDLGLSSSLRYLVQEICRNNRMLYEMVMDEIDNLFSPEVRINIYRIFQESLTNVVRHAQASRIDVEIKKQADRVTFLLKDNGKGFDLKEARSRSLEKRGLGLTTMQERALMAEGSLSLASQAGQGTEVVLTIPLNRQG